jgi:hypothetical protein
MIQSRRSPATQSNPSLKDQPAYVGESNVTWLSRTNVESGTLLLGGTSLAHFRIRIAQAQVRRDLLPSYWSVAGLLIDRKTFWTVPLNWNGDISDVPQNNGIQQLKLADFDDPGLFPNIAVLQFSQQLTPILDAVQTLQAQRGIADLPALLLRWLGFIWAAGGAGNPLLEGFGLPSATFIETIHRIAEIEIAPGLSTGASCPEGIWQAARWWHPYYADALQAVNDPDNVASVPTGVFAVRQPAAAAVAPKA